MEPENQPLLELRNLTTVFPLKRGTVQAVTGIDLKLMAGEILGIVGRVRLRKKYDDVVRSRVGTLSREDHQR
jgi:ABC-type microcin C transport system duplicated ATPase subunit YejF